MKQILWTAGGLALCWAQSLRVLSEDGEPIQSAQVRLQSLPRGGYLTVYTDSSGAIRVPPGRYKVEIVSQGFLSYRGELSLPANAAVRLSRPVFQLNESIITGSYAPVQELRSLYPVRIMTAERLQKQGAMYLPQALVTELNTRLAQDPNLGTFATLQGLGGEHVKVLIDGVPVLGRVSGSIDLSQIPLSEVERVEIVEGPMSVLYGTDAMGGVVNLITRTSRCQWEGRARFQYEGVGVYDAGFSVAGGPAKHRLSVAGGRYYFDGWEPNPARLRAQLWRPREQYNFLVSYQFRPSERFRLRIQAPIGEETFFNLKEPTITPRRIYAIDEYYYTRRIMPAFHLTYQIAPRWRWDQQGAYLYYRRIRNVVYKDLVTLEEIPVPQPGQQDSTEEYQIWTRGGVSFDDGKNSLQIGHEIQHTTITGGRIRDRRAQMGDYALWGTAEWMLSSKLAIRPGFRWAYNTRYSAPFLPALHVRWMPSASLTLRLGYSRGFRAPSLREQFLYLVFTNHNIQGNPDLLPEQSHHVHGNLTWTHMTRHSLWRARLSAFYNTVRDIIQLVIIDPMTLFTTYKNIQRFQTLGIQPRIEFLRENFSVSGGATFTQYRSERWGWEIAAQTSYTWRKVTLSAFFKYQAQVPIFIAEQSGEISWRWIGGFPWLDLSMSRAFWRERVQATLGLRNAFGITAVSANLAGGVHTAGGFSAPVGMGRYPFLRLEYHIQRGQI
ncbi:MAG: TonB-dependent receptor [Bacteroidia bacterium]|nr:TonB-dependent receptor [Bacteroidia bacterium]MCX7651980.1 TonB-dependent receptor [Bacteroidia bacterium]MDW8417585.1 TonB-dependent receptor [Bacteroidia bacterium]